MGHRTVSETPISRFENAIAGCFALAGRSIAAGMILLLAGTVFAQETAPASPPPTGQTAVSSEVPEASAFPVNMPSGSSSPVRDGHAAAAPASSASMDAADGAATSVVMPHDLSPWGMFLAADIVVKAVMLGLAFASLITWTVWLAKSLELFRAKRRTCSAVAALTQASDLGQARERIGDAGRRSVVAALVDAAHSELSRSDDFPPDGIKERVAMILSRIEAGAGRQMLKGTGVLATIGSIAPFIGLFGTVWGIMNSFIGISHAQTTNLAVVAPGIAEALLATALGLVAAIPAVVIYNAFARSIAGYRGLLADASAEVMRHLSRDLDRYVQSPSPVVSQQAVPAMRVLAAE